jgi:type 1 glutamine amidotransferase
MSLGPKGFGFMLALGLVAFACRPLDAADAKKKVVFIPGAKSHGYMAHAHYPGCILLAKALDENVPQVQTTVYHDGGWPKDTTALETADVVVLFSDGGGGQPFVKHLADVDKLVKKGVGVVCLHYAVEVPKGEPGECMLRWIGGYFETFWSVNPTWKAEFKEFPKHPVANGLKPFEMNDEWYYHMRFAEGMQGVTPILTAIPPDKTRERPDGAHSNNPTVRKGKGMPEHLAWTFERPDGGRGVGFTGGHWHWNWANDNFRKTVLNAIVWAAHLEVPASGVSSKAPTMEQLMENQEFPVSAAFEQQRSQIEKLLQEWKEASR